ncbi:MAG: tetratricopeptide repeat protein, partial [Myxococcota bacterium]
AEQATIAEVIPSSVPMPDTRPARASAPTQEAADTMAGSPDLAAAEVKAGRERYRALEFGAAKQHFFRATAHDRRSHAAFFGLAQSHFQLGHHEEAIAAVRRAVELRPRQARYLLLMGELYERTSRYDEAIAALQRAADAGNATATKRLARLRASLP